ncbi:DUF3850 domain-containing protein [Ensifer aridi]|uniref:DUF3850 domain-containing protein n=1 Tax=Ensifer aridi TaxID=1708715 RepID=UPI000A121472|nr:DUF3850 domain-containing protein [Ensifer aridi]
MRHFLKTHPAMFRAVRDGRKNFEVRKDDRAFQAGDTVVLNFHDPETSVSPWAQPAPPAPYDSKDDIHTPLTRKVTFVLRGGQYGVEPGYVVLALENVTDAPK